MQTTEATFPELSRVQRRATVVGIAAIAITILGSLLGGGLAMFFQSYLVGYLMILGCGLGSLAVLMLHHMVGGAWGFILQRFLEAGSRTLPYIFILFLPIMVFGMGSLYGGWMDPESEIVAAKTKYLNVPGFMSRSIVYFAVWMLLMYVFNRWSRELNDTGDPTIVRRMQRLAPPGVILYFMTLTFAAVDWVMSLEPEWFSTIYGPLFVVGQGLTVLSLGVVFLSFMDGRKPLSDVINIEYYHHIGNLMLAFTVLWTYMAFAQYLITWAGNLPEEIVYYLPREGGLLSFVALTLMVGHFAVPFFCLLFRVNKRNPSMLRKIAYWILGMRVVDMLWFVKPAFHPNTLFNPDHLFLDFVTDAGAIVGLGAVWIALYCSQLRRRNLLAKNDPRMDAAFGKVEMLEHA